MNRFLKTGVIVIENIIDGVWYGMSLFNILRMCKAIWVQYANHRRASHIHVMKKYITSITTNFKPHWQLSPKFSDFIFVFISKVMILFQVDSCLFHMNQFGLPTWLGNIDRYFDRISKKCKKNCNKVINRNILKVTCAAWWRGTYFWTGDKSGDPCEVTGAVLGWIMYFSGWK